MSAFSDYPTIQIPAFAERLGLEDDSWHNDAAAKLTRMIGKAGICVWVFEDAPEDRETPDSHKYTVERYEDFEEEFGTGEGAQVVYTGSSDEECEDAIRRALES